MQLFIGMSVFVSACVFAIGCNATHKHETDAYILEDGVFDGTYTRYMPAFDKPVPDGVAIDEIYLRIKFESGETPDINRLKDVSCGDVVVFLFKCC